ncbi:MAG TPA: hypothetical protein VK963_02095 [Candidatus Saccharimonadales bacterium]|nr:hypothetical protein [Candidatus Saccharimonadales bacterium]
MGRSVNDAMVPPEVFMAAVRQGYQELCQLGQDHDGGPVKIGLEVEGCLVDSRGQPLPLNYQVRQHLADPQINLEVLRHQIEINPAATNLTEGLGGLEAALTGKLALVEGAIRPHSGQLGLVGILPTLKTGHLTARFMTPNPRYQVLDDGLPAYKLRIKGKEEAIEFDSDTVAVEGANTSMQIHLDAPWVEDFPNLFNAARLASSVVLAVAGNSPLLLGRRLWHETRIPVFEQTTGGRCSFGRRWTCNPFEPFTELLDPQRYPPLLPESCQNPLAALALHNSTVWDWERAIFNPQPGANLLRVEGRALPAGPTVADMMANCALWIGLTLALAEEMEGWARWMPFEAVAQNFYRSAREGLGAVWNWPGEDNLKQLRATSIVRCLLPAAKQGLVEAGWSLSEIDTRIGAIEGRLESGQTGSVWQLRQLEALERTGLDRPAAVAAMCERYLELSDAGRGRPVHTWPVK